MDQTTNYRLKKPGYDDFADIEIINENSDIIDSTLKTLSDDLETLDDGLTTHTADETKHVSPAERDAWNGKVNKAGDTMTGDLVINKGIPAVSLKPALTPADNTKKFDIFYNASGSNNYGVFMSKDGQQLMQIIDPKNVQFIGYDDAWFSIQDLKQSVSNGKAAIANAITQKGVATSATAEFATMAANINAIPTGTNFASGSIQSNAGVNNTITGLSFTPKYVILNVGDSNASTVVLNNTEYRGQLCASNGFAWAVWAQDLNLQSFKILNQSGSTFDIKWFAFS